MVEMAEFTSSSDLTLTYPSPGGKQMAVASKVNSMASDSDEGGEYFVEGQVAPATRPRAVEKPDLKASRSVWDIAFPTEVAVHQGGRPVWYQEEFFFRSPALFVPS